MFMSLSLFKNKTNKTKCTFLVLSFKGKDNKICCRYVGLTASHLPSLPCACYSQFLTYTHPMPPTTDEILSLLSSSHAFFTFTQPQPWSKSSGPLSWSLSASHVFPVQSIPYSDRLKRSTQHILSPCMVSSKGHHLQRQP